MREVSLPVPYSFSRYWPEVYTSVALGMSLLTCNISDHLCCHHIQQGSHQGVSSLAPTLEREGRKGGG